MVGSTYSNSHPTRPCPRRGDNNSQQLERYVNAMTTLDEPQSNLDPNGTKPVGKDDEGTILGFDVCGERTQSAHAIER